MDTNLIDLLDLESDTPILSFSEIYEKLLANDELIITIPNDQEDSLRKGLASIKVKTNKKLNAEGFMGEDRTLMFKRVHENVNEDTVDLHIFLKARPGCKVLNIRVPDKDI